MTKEHWAPVENKETTCLKAIYTRREEVDRRATVVHVVVVRDFWFPDILGCSTVVGRFLGEPRRLLSFQYARNGTIVGVSGKFNGALALRKVPEAACRLGPNPVWGPNYVGLDK